MMFKAKICFLGPEAGGRHTPPMPGYGPQLQLGKIFTSCIIHSTDAVVVFEFNRPYDVTITLRFPDEYGHLLPLLDTVRLFEGARLVGMGYLLPPLPQAGEGVGGEGGTRIPPSRRSCIIGYVNQRLRRLHLLVLVLAACALLVLAACADSTAPAATPAPPTPTLAPPTATPLPRGGALTIRLAEDVADLRPWQPRSRGEEQIVQLLYNGLTRLDPQLRPAPDLASDWLASPDGLAITMTLRPNLQWHDGRPVQASDVQFTIETLKTITPTTALLLDLQRITRVTAPTTQTVVLTLAERYAPIFSVLALPILPQHLLAGRDLATFDFWQSPVGSGPFVFGERRAGEAIVLTANPSYFRGQPLLDRAAFVVARDPAIARTALGDGRLLLAELPWSESQAITDTLTGAQSASYAENGYFFLALNTRDGRPFADAGLRRALALTLDVPTIVAAATDGQGIPIASSAAPGSWADVTPVTPADPAAAAVLFDAAGWRAPAPGGIRERDGVPLTARLSVRADDPRRVRAAELIAASARSAGISVTLQLADFETTIRAMTAPPYDFDMLLAGWTNGMGDPGFADYAYYDPDDFPLFHASQITQGVTDTRAVQNIIAFRDGAYDNQAAAARQLYAFDARLRAQTQAQQRIADQRPYIFLWADRLPVVLAPQVTTLDGPVDLATPMYLHNIERWYLRR